MDTILQSRNCAFHDAGACVHTLKSNKCRKEIFFTIRVVRYWHNLLREAVGLQSLQVLKNRMDKALSNLF